MRVAIVSDIHGNLVALETVLADIAVAEVDQTVCLGDVAAFGPQPREAVERLAGLALPTVMGNTDARLLNPHQRPERERTEDTRRIEDIDRWCAAQLSSDDRSYLRTFRPTIEQPLGDGAMLLLFHGSPHSNTDIIVATTPDAELESLLAPFHATVMAGGHTHAQMLRRYRDSLVINPGSVGLPHEDTGGATRNPPWAEYAIVSWENRALRVELRRAPVDLAAVVQAARESEMPHAAWWAGDWR